ncbi:hypothetical protein [Sphingobacterium faecium]|uniref:hypothetical protein n=1 Tax=Sphingobacterium faecium TaxID=34087 RepID=UPI000D35AA6A|nr:hypothetical protein [Sphingobacterium faecium]
MDANTERCKRDSERQTAISTSFDASNSFLKCQFLPKLNAKEGLQFDYKAKRTVRDFYKSLTKTASKFNINPLSTINYPFPYNISLGIWDMQTKLKENVADWENLHIAQSKRKTYLASKQVHYTGSSLYYIPVIPLYKMIKDPERKRNARLLLSVFSYLHSIANVPYYRNESSYLYYHYEMHREWVEQDEEEEEDAMGDIVKAEIIGDSILKKLQNPFNLNVFEQRLRLFNKVDDFDRDCWMIANEAYALYNAYPKESIFRNSLIPEINPYDDDERIIRMDQYISFYAEDKGWLYNNIKETVNNEFNECSQIEVPTIFTPIDGSRIAGYTLDFEKRFFNLLCDLCTLLYDYK